MIILAGVLVHRAMRPLRNRCVAVFRVVVAALIEWLVGTLCVSIQLTFSQKRPVCLDATTAVFLVVVAGVSAGRDREITD